MADIVKASANPTGADDAEARARRGREKQANISASEKLNETRSPAIGEGMSVDEVEKVVFLVESDPAVIKCRRVQSLHLGLEDLLVNLDVTFRDDLAEGEVLTAVDRIEEEVEDELPQANRVFIESASLSQVYRRHRDRRLAYEVYVKDKRLSERVGSRVAKKMRRDERILEGIRERRARWREETADAFNRTYFPNLAMDASEVADEAQAKAKVGASAPRKLFSEVPSIVGERVVLNRVVDADADALLDLIENSLVQRYLPVYLFEKKFDDVRDAISQLYGDLFRNKESLILAIRYKETGELAGLAEFYGLRDDLHKISVGYRLRECFWGRGLATEAARLMVGYLYGETDIEIITASTMIGNEASAHVLEKADFVRTARGVEEDWGFAEPTIVDKWFC